LRQAQASETVNLFAPSILTLEVANTLWKGIKLKRLSEEDCREALEALANASIAIYEIEWQQAPDVLDIACKLDITVYDATYVFLSEKLGAQLITSDNSLYEKAKRRFRLLHLKDYV
jgi:predicted nucleic acid-binding protein